MTSAGEPTPELDADQAGRPGRAEVDPDVLRQLADQLHRSITQTFEDWSGEAGVAPEGDRSARPTFSRPVAVPPVRMEQLARTPEPTADLDDLVDLLVPRLLEKLVPALREALRDEDELRVRREGIEPPTR